MKNANSFSSVAAKAFARDKAGNVYTGEALFMAILFHCSGGDRTVENENQLAEMLDDVNIKADKQRRKKK